MWLHGNASTRSTLVIDASTNLIWWFTGSRIPDSWNELATEVRTQGLGGQPDAMFPRAPVRAHACGKRPASRRRHHFYWAERAVVPATRKSVGSRLCGRSLG